MTSEMILASLSKIWHIIPIIVAIILFKKFINYKDKKSKIIKNEENERNGLTLQLRTIKKYKDLGYEIVNEFRNDEDINLHIKKGKKIILIKLNNTPLKKSIKDIDIKAFRDDASNYASTNNIDDNDINLRYVVPYSDVFHKSALKLLGNDSFGCKYVVV